MSQLTAGEAEAVTAPSQDRHRRPRSAAESRSWRSEDRLLVRTARQGGGWLVLLSLTTLVLAGLQVVLPAVLGRALDAVVGHASRKWLVWAAVMLLVLALGAALSEVANGAATARSTAWLRAGLLRQILGLGTRQSLRFPAGELASRLSANADDAGGLAPRSEERRVGTEG